MTDQRLLDKAHPILRLAEENGWEVEHRDEVDADGLDMLQLVGVLHGRVAFGFTVAFGINPETGRAVTLRLDGKRDAAFVVTTPDDGRYWYGPLSRYRHALTDPYTWTGVDA